MTSPAPGTSEAYEDLVRTARRLTRSADEARDLVQDVVLIALARGFEDWPSPERRPWLRGVVRNHAAFVARTESRRRRRDSSADDTSTDGADRFAWRPDFLSALPPSLRAVASLVSADLCAAEIRWLLGLSETALRKRLSDLRAAVRAEPEQPTERLLEPARTLGPHRPLLLADLRRQGGRALASHDPDGHAIFLRVGAHGSGWRGNP